MPSNYKGHSSQEAIQPDEIEMIDENASTNKRKDAFSSSAAKVEDLRAFCHARPWLRFFALMLFWLSVAIGVILLACTVVNALFCLASVGKNELVNQRLARSWNLFCATLAAALSFLVGIISPFFVTTDLIWGRTLRNFSHNAKNATNSSQKLSTTRCQRSRQASARHL